MNPKELKRLIEQALEKNNENRDDKWEQVLTSLKETMIMHTNNSLKHVKSSPETMDALKAIQANCTKTSNEYNLTQKLMQRDIEQIKDYIKEDAAWKKATLEKFEANFATKEELLPIKRMQERLVGFALAVLVIFALVSLYFVFSGVGLPTP